MKNDPSNVAASERSENLRLQYSQIMENFRHAVRGGISATLIFLAITGLAVQVSLSKEYDIVVKRLIIVFTFNLALLELAVAAWIITYLKRQQKILNSISEELGITADDSLDQTVKIAVLCVSALLLLLLFWGVYFAMVT